MPNPGSFKGSRKEFLLGEKEAYCLGVEGGYAVEALAIIHRRYFKRFPADLGDSFEPTPEFLAAVDDDAPDPDVPEPDKDSMSSEEYSAALLALTARQKFVTFKKAQIKRWMIYQHVKDNDSNPKDASANTPYNKFVANLSGKDLPKPRLKTGVNLWRKEHRSEIEALEKSESAAQSLGKSVQAALRDRIARELYARLPDEERDEWSKKAQAEHEVALENWKKDVNCGVSTNPADQQVAIQGLVQFVQPVLDAIRDATGWKASLIAGGPEPAQKGQLNVISVHSGTTSGDVKMTFGCSERQKIKKNLIPVYGAFLRKCYTPEECRARALSSDLQLGPIAQKDFAEENAIVHGLTPAVSIFDTSTSSPAPLSTPSVPTLSASIAIGQAVAENLNVAANSEVDEATQSDATTANSDVNASQSDATGTAQQSVNRGVDSELLTDVLGEGREAVNPFPFSINLGSQSPPVSPQRDSALFLPVTPAHSRPASPAPPLPTSSAHETSAAAAALNAQSQVWSIIMSGISAPVPTVEVPLLKAAPPCSSVSQTRRSSTRLAKINENQPVHPAINKAKGKRTARALLTDATHSLQAVAYEDGPPAKRTRSSAAQSKGLSESKGKKVGKKVGKKA